MKKNQMFYVIMSIFAIGLLTMASCSTDDPKPKPTPDFTYEINDKTVTFTNTSKDATSYSWDFGDGSATVTETSPVHDYAAYGDYDVRLTAKGDGGEEIKKTTISVVKEWPEITIDGDFSDWNNVEVLYAASMYDSTTGTLTEAKVTSNSSLSKLYVYVKGTMNADFPVVQIMIDYDGDKTTGWTDTVSGLQDNGAEIQYEFAVLDDYCSVWGYVAGVDPAWPWDTEITNDTENGDISETSGVINGTEIEFVIETSTVYSGYPPMSTDHIRIYFWQQPEDWSSTSGFLPPLFSAPLENAKVFSFQ